MRRYITQRQARALCWDDDEWYGQPATMTVYEEERGPRPTGIFDQHGNELYAVDERAPIGIVRG